VFLIAVIIKTNRAMIMGIEYHNFDLKFYRDKKTYICEASSSKFGEAKHQFKLPFSPDKIEDFLK
jgi:hypothetical protein